MPLYESCYIRLIFAYVWGCATSIWSLPTYEVVLYQFVLCHEVVLYQFVLRLYMRLCYISLFLPIYEVMLHRFDHCLCTYMAIPDQFDLCLCLYSRAINWFRSNGNLNQNKPNSIIEIFSSLLGWLFGTTYISVWFRLKWSVYTQLKLCWRPRSFPHVRFQVNKVSLFSSFFIFFTIP